MFPALETVGEMNDGNDGDANANDIREAEVQNVNVDDVFVAVCLAQVQQED